MCSYYTPCRWWKGSHFLCHTRTMRILLSPESVLTLLPLSAMRCHKRRRDCCWPLMLGDKCCWCLCCCCYATIGASCHFATRLLMRNGANLKSKLQRNYWRLCVYVRATWCPYCPQRLKKLSRGSTVKSQASKSRVWHAADDVLDTVGAVVAESLVCHKTHTFQQNAHIHTEALAQYRFACSTAFKAGIVSAMRGVIIRFIVWQRRSCMPWRMSTPPPQTTCFGNLHTRTPSAN